MNLLTPILILSSLLVAGIYAAAAPQGSPAPNLCQPGTYTCFNNKVNDDVLVCNAQGRYVLSASCSGRCKFFLLHFFWLGWLVNLKMKCADYLLLGMQVGGGAFCV